MSFPYLDVVGFRRRTPAMAAEVDYVETESPGFIAQRISSRTSFINARLRKRYGNAGPNIGNSLPFGAAPPAVVATLNSPGITLQGVPTLGSIQLDLRITTGGILGAAVFQYSWDGGLTFTSGVTAAATVSLGYGLTAYFTAATYATTDAYTAATPVPETILGWLVTLVTWDLYRRRGVNPQDAGLELLRGEVETALAELKEAADGVDGLIDIPSSEDEDSAVTTGGPLGCSEASPYVWTDIEASEGSFEDSQFSRWRR
jgi:hypothetical protein